MYVIILMFAFDRFAALEGGSGAVGGGAILEGEELGVALRAHPSLRAGGVGVPPGRGGGGLEEEVARLEEQTHAVSLRRRSLAWQRDKLAMHQTALGDRSARLDGLRARSARGAGQQRGAETARLDDAKVGALGAGRQSKTARLEAG